MIHNGTLVHTEMVSKYLGLGKLHLEMRGRTTRKPSEDPEQWGPDAGEDILGQDHSTQHSSDRTGETALFLPWVLAPSYSPPSALPSHCHFQWIYSEAGVRCCPLRFRRREARIEQTCSGLGRRKENMLWSGAVIITSSSPICSIEGGRRQAFPDCCYWLIRQS